MSAKEETKKYRNLRRDPHVAISFLDFANPQRYVEIRGKMIAFALYETLDFVNLLARKYTGADFQHGHAGERRYKLTIRVESWTGKR